MPQQEIRAGRLRDPDTVDTVLWRNITKWGVAFAFVVALTALLVSLQLFQVTSEGAAKRTLRRSVAVITEIDPLLDAQYDQLSQQARDARPGETFRLQDFPINVELSPDDVRNSTKAQFRDLLLDRSAGVMYAQGTEPLRADTAREGSAGRFSLAGIADHGLGFLRSRNHDRLAVLTLVLAALCAALGVTLGVVCRGFGRLASLGAVVVAAALPLLLAGIGARFYMRIASDRDNDYIQREFLAIGQGLAWIPIRDGLAFLALGLAFLVTGVACALWSDRRAVRN